MTIIKLKLTEGNNKNYNRLEKIKKLILKYFNETENLNIYFDIYSYFNRLLFDIINQIYLRMKKLGRNDTTEIFYSFSKKRKKFLKNLLSDVKDNEFKIFNINIKNSINSINIFMDFIKRFYN